VTYEQMNHYWASGTVSVTTTGTAVPVVGVATKWPYPTARERELLEEINALRTQLAEAAHRDLATRPTLPMMAVSPPPPNPLDGMVCDKRPALGHEEGPSAVAETPKRTERVIPCQDQYDPDE
jgi:hypothetical protein